MNVSIVKNFKISLRTSKYDPKFPSIIGRVVGRAWNPEKKRWEIPLSSIPELVKTMTQENIWSEHDADIILGLMEQIIDYTKADTSLVENNILLPLRPYQLETLKFFKNRGSALGALDMSLGKTCISLAYLFDLRQSGRVEKALIVVPVSAVMIWYREAKKFFGDKIKLCAVGYDIREDGTIKKLNKAERTEQLESSLYDGYIINYEKLKDIVVGRDDKGSPILLPSWDKTHQYIVIADEVTRVKSWSAQRTKAIKSLPSTYRIGLSGRPIENNVTEFYTILDWIWPRCLGSWSQFEKRFTITDEYGKVVSVKEKQTLKDIAKYIAIQYSRFDVLKFLPPISRNQYDIELSAEEEEDYKKISRRVDDAIQTMYSAENRKSVINVLALLQVSRMFCDHPVLVRNSPSPTAQELGITSSKASKLEEFKVILDEILALKSKVVVFSQFSKMIDILETAITNKYPMIKVYKHVGGLGAIKSQKLIDDFTHDQNPSVFLSTDSGAYAIQLQCASYCINYDLPWNPAILEQRISRLHRPGQENTVVVINLVVKGVDKVEEKMLGVISKKNQLYKDLMDVSIDDSFRRISSEIKDLVG